jgi:hypothetical protein
MVRSNPTHRLVHQRHKQTQTHTHTYALKPSGRWLTGHGFSNSSNNFLNRECGSSKQLYFIIEGKKEKSNKQTRRHAATAATIPHNIKETRHCAPIIGTTVTAKYKELALRYAARFLAHRYQDLHTSKSSLQVKFISRINEEGIGRERIAGWS